MRILLDECVDWRLLRDLTEYDAKTVKQLGWEHVDDGSLLALAADRFDVFVTVDKDLPNEQDITEFEIAVIVLRGRTTRIVDLRELLGLLHQALRRAQPRQLQVVRLARAALMQAGHGTSTARLNSDVATSAKSGKPSGRGAPARGCRNGRANVAVTHFPRRSPG